MGLKKIDLDFGEKNEEETILKLDDYFKTKFFKNTNKYGIIDFFNEDKKIYIELKSRRINHDLYPTALIGLNKIKYFKMLKDCECFICYKYNDGLFLLKYSNDLFKTFDIKKNFKNNFRQDVGKNEFSDVVLIPYSSLKKYYKYLKNL